MTDYTWFKSEGEAIKFLNEDGWKLHPPSGVWTKGNKKAQIKIITPNKDVRIFWLQK